MPAHIGDNVTISGDRLMADLMETASFGGTPAGGIRRLALSNEDKLVRDWFEQNCTALGCNVTVDSMGNQFARLEGQVPSLPPLIMGSHLDTQPTGGKYDGILGVLSGLAVLRTLHDSGYRPRHPIELVNWTNEEGARFTPAMLASGVFAGVFTQDEAYRQPDGAGVSFGDALSLIGYKGDEPCGQHPVRAYFELHIEQGPVLEAERRTIGVVTGVQGIRWLDVTLTGRESHAGTTPMPLRADALLTAAKLMIMAEEIATAYAPDAKVTVGTLDIHPGSRNVVPGTVTLSMDLRHPDNDVLEKMEQTFRENVTQHDPDTGVTIDIRPFWNSPAVAFDPRCIRLVAKAANSLGFDGYEIVSGAGHDAAYMARVCPTAMIFIPCAGGLSHNEAEHAEPRDIVAGANVLLRTILAADREFD